MSTLEIIDTEDCPLVKSLMESSYTAQIVKDFDADQEHWDGQGPE